jgi:hypothetical protein
VKNPGKMHRIHFVLLWLPPRNKQKKTKQMEVAGRLPENAGIHTWNEKNPTRDENKKRIFEIHFTRDEKFPQEMKTKNAFFKTIP